MFGLLSSVFGLLLYWGLISLPATTQRDGILPGASDVMGILCIFFFFLVENLWACHEQATCNGLIVGLACRGLRFVFCFFSSFFFQILVQIFFGFFFFFWLESRTDYR